MKRSSPSFHDHVPAKLKFKRRKIEEHQLNILKNSEQKSGNEPSLNDGGMNSAFKATDNSFNASLGNTRGNVYDNTMTHDTSNDSASKNVEQGRKTSGHINDHPGQIVFGDLPNGD